MLEPIVLPSNISRQFGTEVNFVIQQFRKLPVAVRNYLANVILNNPTDSDNYAKAGHCVFALIDAGEENELLNYVTEVLFNGEKLFDAYLVSHTTRSAKACRCTRHFRDNLESVNDSYDLPEFIIPYEELPK